MGHILSKQGTSTVKSKLETIQQAPRPADVSQLRSFLGMINYYSKFILDFSSKLHPLYELLSKKFKWFEVKVVKQPFCGQKRYFQVIRC